jgi:hypothetical protein
MQVHTENIMTVVDRWFDNADPGDWVGVFENHALDSATLGMRIGFLYGIEAWEKAVIGQTHAPDSAMGLGWKFILVAKCKTREEAREAMNQNETTTPN